MLLIKIILFSIAIFQGMIIGFLLLKSPFFKSKSNKFLAYALFSASWVLLDIILEISNSYKLFPYLKVIETLDALLLFPTFILLFVIHQVKSPQRNSKKLLWLFIPTAFIVIVLAFFNYFFNDFKDLNETNMLLAFLLIGLLYIITLSFIPYCLIKTYKYIKLSIYKEEKQWLLKLWKFEVFLLVMVMLLFVISPFVVDLTASIIQLIALFGTLFIHWIAYSGVYKLKLKSDREKIRALLTNKFFNANKFENIKEKSSLPKPHNNETNNKEDLKVTITNLNIESHKQEFKTNEYTSTLSKENIYFKRLEDLCLNEKIYRDNTLDRNKVAKMLGISPNYFSQIINSETGSNFTTYINRYRVEDVKKIILNKEFENYSLLAIGLECGFSSKTTFHNSFKKITGMTPNAYKSIHK
ncbi:helix-turn-helix domain-containing protein [Tenacibaculum sp. ZS6-P6]|uniref:helix-turn-helix domain-containing protein n=1 Tax=Tenacibaculum sp. ZS6-P6 TaxID=3447503 RepID=UPI003F9E8210